MRALARLRWGAFGLRGRIVGAVVVTTTVTLVVAAAVLLPQLESSLKKASQATLRSDVNDTHADGDIKQLQKIPYWEISLATASSTRELESRGLEAAKNLNNAQVTLERRLGTSSVTLIGYIDAQGRGRPIVPLISAPAVSSNGVGVDGAADAAAEVAEVAQTAGTLDDVRQAFEHHSTVYSFSSVNGTPVVRAAIWLGHDSVLAVRKSIDEIPGAVSAVRRAFEIGAAAAILLTILLAIPLAGTLVRRLQLLREAALQLAIDGTGSGARFPVDRARDEVGDLARSFSIMQRRLRQQEGARRSFVATASHELRTPLASLDGMLELLAEGLQDEHPDLEDVGELLDRARGQSRRLIRLAADLLDLSRIDAEVPLRSEPIELSELVRAVLAEFEIPNRGREVAAVLLDGGRQTWVLADPGSIARILRILLDNAARVAPPGSELQVVVTRGPQPTLSVIDQGPGVPKEERALIFERFKRGRETGGEAGFGLGLAIGRELAHRMHGSLVLADTDGPGATFTLTLPPAPEPAADLQAGN